MLEISSKFGDNSRTARRANNRAQPEMAPDGRQMRLPRRLRWQACDTDGSPLLDLEGEVDTPATYGLGCGYVAGYAYTGTLEGRRIEGRAYLVYIDRRH